MAIGTSSGATSSSMWIFMIAAGFLCQRWPASLQPDGDPVQSVQCVLLCMLPCMLPPPLAAALAARALAPGAAPIPQVHKAAGVSSGITKTRMLQGLR